MNNKQAARQLVIRKIPVRVSGVRVNNSKLGGAMGLIWYRAASSARKSLRTHLYMLTCSEASGVEQVAAEFRL